MNWLIIVGIMLIAAGTFLTYIGYISTDQESHKEVLEQFQKTNKKIDEIKSYTSNSHSQQLQHLTDTTGHLEGNSPLINIINNIKSMPDDNGTYDELINYLQESKVGKQLTKNMKTFHSTLYAISIGGKAMICTVNQYNIDGFMLFFDLKTEDIIMADFDFKLGIDAVKIYDNAGFYPNFLVVVKYISMTGTGVKSESVRFYAVDGINVLLALDKPYSCFISESWKAFKSEVLFEQNNIIGKVTDKLQIISIGQVRYYDTKSGQDITVPLPQEQYMWDVDSSKFIQVSGRLTVDQSDLASIYADYAEPTDDWFKIPKSKQNTVFKEEKW